MSKHQRYNEVKPMKTSRIALLSTLIMLMCSCTKSTKLPDHVTDAEVKVFQGWLDRHATNNPDRTLFVLKQTYSADQQEWSYCATKILAGGARKSMLQSLHENDKDYPIPSVPPDWKYQWIGSPAYTQNIKGNFDSIGFSRAAFSPDGNEALFAFSFVHCEKNGCGGGAANAVLATKLKENWSYKSIGCRWIVD